MSKCIVYFHGFNGSPEADSKIAIQQAFPEHLVLSYPIVHQEGPAKIAAKLEKALDPDALYLFTMVKLRPPFVLDAWYRRVPV